eukprot:13245180-Alexandrium_andersonii.AAC.1
MGSWETAARVSEHTIAICTDQGVERRFVFVLSSMAELAESGYLPRLAIRPLDRGAEAVFGVAPRP